MRKKVQQYRLITRRMRRPHIKFNRGKGAIVCRTCGKTLKENLSIWEWLGITKRSYCLDCAKELVMKLFKTIKYEHRSTETTQCIRELSENERGQA